MWHEAVASKGSNEVGSSILKYLQDINMSPATTHLITYSDSCGGQNRNIYLVCLWLHIVACSYLPLTTVDQKFQAIYISDDWYALVQEARCRNAFSVCEMKSENFVSIKSLKSHIVNRKKNTHKQPVNWLDIHWIRVTKDQPFHFSYKYSHNALEAWKVVDLSHKTKGRPVDMGKISLPRLYNSPGMTNEKKLDDLLSLLDFIPPVHHSFYQGLGGCAGDDSVVESDDRKLKPCSHCYGAYIAPPVICNCIHNVKPKK